MFRLLASSHKMFYLKTALKFLCMPDLVYDVAHGRNIDSEKTDKIRAYLLEKKLIMRRKHHKINEKER